MAGALEVRGVTRGMLAQHQRGSSRPRVCNHVPCLERCDAEFPSCVDITCKCSR